jgi:hypothetical protein
MNVKHENYDLILENYVFSDISVNFSIKHSKFDSRTSLIREWVWVGIKTIIQLINQWEFENKLWVKVQLKV